MQNPATQRIIALVDMDCFYCQVETRLNPSLKGKPVAVVQYNQWKGGGIIAVNYEARDKGVKRGMRGDDAKEKCPEIQLVPVPTIRGKADLSNYRDAGEEVAQIFSEFSSCVQRASIDEAYLDLTKSVEEFMNNYAVIKIEDLANTYVVGHCNLKEKNEDERVVGLKQWLSQIESDQIIESANYRLAIGGVIVENMRAKIFEKTGFHCSAGIAHNKVLAKLTAGLHKPKKQTILPHDSVPELYETVPIYKVRSLGGKLGKLVSEKLSITHMSELFKFSLQDLQQKFDDKTSSWLYNIARGIDLEPVTARLMAESIGCCKNFTGINQLAKRSEVEHWLKELATEVSERLTRDLEKNKRRAKLLTVSFVQETNMTRCGPLNSYDVNRIARDALDLIKKFNSAPPGTDLWKPPIKNLGLSASKFTEELTSIVKFFNLKSTQQKTVTEEKLSGTPLAEKFSKVKENSSSSPCTNADEMNPKLSFFVKFLNQKKTLKSTPEEKTLQEQVEEDGREPKWISSSKVIPNLNEAEPEVVNIFPEELKETFNKRPSSNSEERQIENSETDNPNVKVGMEIVGECPKERCNECGKEFPIDIFLEHLDYHAALKLSNEINQLVAVTSSARVVEQNIIQSKRRKHVGKTPSKKMKSITSFFSTVSK